MKRFTVAIATLCLFGLWTTPAQADDPKPEPPKEEVKAPAPAKDEAKAAEPVKEEAKKEEVKAAEPKKEEAKKEEAKKEEAKEEAKAEPKKDEAKPKDPIEQVGMIVSAIQAGNWPLAVGLLLSLLIVILNRVVKLKDKVGKKAMPWVVAVLGMAGTVSAGLIAGLAWQSVLLAGFFTGTTAIAFWELVLKHWFRKKEADPTPVEPEEAVTPPTAA